MELLAPAGDFETAVAAFQAGADACYIGGEMSARAYAKNFSRDDISNILNKSRLWNRKLYVALNTMIFEREMEGALEYAAFLYDIGVDAIIGSDIGLVKNIRDMFPNMPVHLSTQAGVHTAEGAKAALDLGCARVVAARECTFRQLKEMGDTGIEVEAFCHGALCSSVSGMCLMSAMIGGRSGNRGRCAQPCRMEYAVGEKKGYLLSAADLCAIGHLDQFAQAGVCSLKIEGRMKRREYVAIVVKAYRDALDGRGNVEQAVYDMKRVYNRGEFTRGYLDGNRDITYIARQNHMGVCIGVVDKIEKGRACIRTDKELVKGDGIEFMGEKSRGGLILPYADKSPAGYWVKAVPHARKGDRVFRTTDARQLQEARESLQDPPKIGVDMELRGALGERASLAVSAEGFRAEAQGDVCQQAQKPMDREAVKRSLKKAGGTPFHAELININIDKNVYLSISNINAMRREALRVLEGMLLEKRRPYVPTLGARRPLPKGEQPRPVSIAAQVRTQEQALAAWRAGADRVYYCPRNIALPGDKGGELWMVLPPYLSQEEQGRIMAYLRENREKLDGIVVGNIGQYRQAREISANLLFDFWMNVGNRASAGYLRQFGRVTASLEANLQNISAMAGYIDEAVVFGHGPVMNLRHCPLKKQGLCPNCEGQALTDSKGYQIPCARIGGKECLLQLLNPVCMAFTDLEKLRERQVYGYRLMFFYEKEETVEQVTRAYKMAAARGTKAQVRDIIKYESNRGHYDRGVL